MLGAERVLTKMNGDVLTVEDSTILPAAEVHGRQVVGLVLWRFALLFVVGWAHGALWFVFSPCR